MNELVKIETRQLAGARIQTVNARDLHAALRISKDFSNWIKAQIERARLQEGRDYLLAQKGEQLPSGTKWLKEYHLTLDAAKHIAMVSGTERGFQVREYFLECERRLQSRQDPVQTLNDPAALRGLLLNYSEKVIELQHQVDDAQPKVEFHDAVTKDDGCHTMQDAAKILGTGGNRLFELLREHGILMANNAPYQKWVNAGYFKIRYTYFKHPRSGEIIKARTMVTGSGLTFLFKLIRRLGMAPPATTEGSLATNSYQ